MVEILLRFVRVNKHEIFKFNDATALFDKIPKMASDLMKGYLAGSDMAVESGTWNFCVGLPVLRAVHSSDELFESETADLGPAGLGKLPCLLYPIKKDPRFPFAVVNPVTEQKIDSLGWIAPPADRVRRITSHHNSKIVRVDMGRKGSRSKTWLYIRFDDREDAGAFVELYCRANPRIESVHESTGTKMSAAMRVRVARISDTSRWLRRNYKEDSHGNW